MRITNDFITELNDDEIFVFGSNESGIHGGGAAKLAFDKFGAIWNNPVGIQGRSYAIPTKSKGIVRTLTIEEIKPYVNDFIEFAKNNNSLKFMVTEIGCGLAGLKPEQIAPLFIDCIDMVNVWLPKRFIDVLTK